MTNRYTKRCSTLLITMEVLIKTIMRYYLMPVRMTNIKKQGIIIAGENVKHKNKTQTLMCQEGK